ncbi:MAG: CHAD domain-containing protein [Gammaproteobacteria bacterium]|nr:CHAD domain-containing protein [Gammaproteobacteria bacterium]
MDLRQALSERLDAVVLALVRAGHDPVEGVHEARKVLKQVRALLRVLRPVMSDQARAAGVQCRDMARSLSASRDLQVMLDTCSQLQAEAPESEAMDDPALMSALQQVSDHLQTRLAQDQMPDTLVLAAQMSVLRATLSGALASLRPGESVALYRKQLARFERKACKAWQHALEDANAIGEAFHEARKRAKDWMYVMRVEQAHWSRQQKRVQARLKAWTETLGQINDLEVLSVHLQDMSGVDAAVVQRVLFAIDRRRARLMMQARDQAPV